MRCVIAGIIWRAFARKWAVNNGAQKRIDYACYAICAALSITAASVAPNNGPMIGTAA